MTELRNIIFKRSDGGVTVSYNVALDDINSTIEKVYEQFNPNQPSNETIKNWHTLYGKILGHRVVEVGELPEPEFRNAWTDDFDTDTVDVDPDKAKEIKREQFRLLRKPLLKALDTDFLKAMEEDDQEKKDFIAAAKQELRDVTDIELPEDVQELKEYFPACLVS